MSASFACSWACLSTREQDEALRTKVPLGGLYMDAQETGAHRTAKTILAAGLLLLVLYSFKENIKYFLLLVFFFQSAAAVVNSLEGAASAVARGLVIWAFVLITIVFYCVKYRALLRRFCRYALRSYLVSYLRLFLSPATASGPVSPYMLSTIFVRL